MEAIIPYLNFNGQAAEALAFYAKALNGKVLFQQSYGDTNTETPADWKDKVMHATFQAGALTIMASDVMHKDMQVTTGNNLSMSVNFTTLEGMDETFTALAEGGNITMPLQDTFWGAKFGMLTDKFGFGWMFNHDYEKKD